MGTVEMGPHGEPLSTSPPPTDQVGVEEAALRVAIAALRAAKRVDSEETAARNGEDTALVTAVANRISADLPVSMIMRALADASELTSRAARQLSCAILEVVPPGAALRDGFEAALSSWLDECLPVTTLDGRDGGQRAAHGDVSASRAERAADLCNTLVLRASECGYTPP